MTDRDCHHGELARLRNGIQYAINRLEHGLEDKALGELRTALRDADTLEQQYERCELESALAVSRDNEANMSSAVAANEERILHMQEAHKALHRRCQQAESALVTYRKLTALPPDGDGVRFVSGTMGRAMLVWLCDEGTREIEALGHDIERQHEACSEHLAEVERLRAFVRAWDEWRAAHDKATRIGDGLPEAAACIEARAAVGEVTPPTALPHTP